MRDAPCTLSNIVKRPAIHLYCLACILTSARRLISVWPDQLILWMRLSLLLSGLSPILGVCSASWFSQFMGGPDIKGIIKNPLTMDKSKIIYQQKAETVLNYLDQPIDRFKQEGLDPGEETVLESSATKDVETQFQLIDDAIGRMSIAFGPVMIESQDNCDQVQLYRNILSVLHHSCKNDIELVRRKLRLYFTKVHSLQNGQMGILDNPQVGSYLKLVGEKSGLIWTKFAPVSHFMGMMGLSDASLTSISFLLAYLMHCSKVVMELQRPISTATNVVLLSVHEYTSHVEAYLYSIKMTEESINKILPLLQGPADTLEYVQEKLSINQMIAELQFRRDTQHHLLQGHWETLRMVLQVVGKQETIPEGIVTKVEELAQKAEEGKKAFDSFVTSLNGNKASA